MIIKVIEPQKKTTSKLNWEYSIAWCSSMLKQLTAPLRWAEGACPYKYLEYKEPFRTHSLFWSFPFVFYRNIRNNAPFRKTKLDFVIYQLQKFYMADRL